MQLIRTPGIRTWNMVYHTEYHTEYGSTLIIVQSGLKLYCFTILAAGVKPNKFVIRSHNGAIMCRPINLFDRTEDRI